MVDAFLPVRHSCYRCFGSSTTAPGARQGRARCVEPTRCGGLWDGLVDTGAKAAADWNVTG